MKQIICIYHSRDLDGFTSAAIVKKKYPDAELIGFDYGQELPMDRIPRDVPIVIVDVSLPMDKMEFLAKHSGYQLTWIDHHKSAIAEFESYMAERESFMVVFLKNGIAACELAWQYFFPNVPMPIGVGLIGEYDTWRNGDKERWELKILPFQFGMRSICNSPETFPPKILDIDHPFLMEDLIEQTMRYGEAILNYQAKVSELLCRRGAFEFTIDGYRAICLNAGGINSDAFKSVYDESRHDVMMPFFFGQDKWIFSLYTTKDNIDCSVIAKGRGGGGHKGAAGFEAISLSSVFGDASI